MESSNALIGDKRACEMGFGSDRRHMNGAVKYIVLDGKVFTVSDLPPRLTRWTIRRKAQVVAAVEGGLLRLEDACQWYNLTVEEFFSWQRAIQSGGMKSLRVTHRMRKTKN